MSTAEMSTDWQALQVFKGIDLYDSFVLGWSLKNHDLTFRLEVSVWPDSEYYKRPKAGEHTCYLKATLRFTQVSHVQGLLSQAVAESTTDPDGSTDYGTIEGLQIRQGHYLIEGDFGRVEFFADDMVFSTEVHEE